MPSMSEQKPSGAGETFRRFAPATSVAVGSPWAFLCAVGVLVIWAVLGPIYHYSDTWQLVINTGTTIVTFLMVFLIQNTQNRDSEAMHLKLDELIRAVKGAHNALLDLEELDDEELERVRGDYAKLAEKARRTLHAAETKLAQTKKAARE